jgi:hypothetical protein
VGRCVGVVCEDVGGGGELMVGVWEGFEAEVVEAEVRKSLQEKVLKWLEEGSC